LSASDVQAMIEQLRGGLIARMPEVRLQGEVEIDEIDVVAGHTSIVSLSVCRAWSEYARDEDGDGFREVHVNSVGSPWTLSQLLR
jgi:hypothetical protein